MIHASARMFHAHIIVCTRVCVSICVCVCVFVPVCLMSPVYLRLSMLIHQDRSRMFHARNMRPRRDEMLDDSILCRNRLLTYVVVQGVCGVAGLVALSK